MLRVANRDAVSLPHVRELFTRAFANESHPDAEDAWAWCGAFVVSPSVRIWVVRDDEMNLVALAICNFVGDVWAPDPFILAMYSEKRAATEALLAEIRVWGRGLGQERFRAVNMSGRSDKRFEHIWEGFASGARQGSLYLFEWGDQS